MKEQTVREYAISEQLTLGSVYRRIWEGQVDARQVLGRWLINSPAKKADEEKETN